MNQELTPEKEGTYTIFQNEKGEILIMLNHRCGGPENPRLVYDGGNRALLYRSRESAVFLENINEEARPSIKAVDEVLVAELDGEEVAREYEVPVRIVRSLEALGK